MELEGAENLSMTISFSNGKDSTWHNLTGNTALYVINALDELIDFPGCSPYLEVNFENMVFFLDLSSIIMIRIYKEESTPIDDDIC